MAVLPLKTEKLCKICQSVHRTEIDKLLELRSKRGTEDGQRVNLEYVLATLGDRFGIANPTEDNVKNHWRKHCEVISDENVAAHTQKAMLKELEKVRGGEIDVDINADLDKMWAVGMAELEARLARGDRSGITPEMMMKIAAEKTRRRHNETQRDLLGMLAGGIAHAVAGGPKQIESAEIIDVEAEEEE